MNGCFDRPPLEMTLEVQDGWEDCRNPENDWQYARLPVMVRVPHAMTRNCQYTLTALGRVDAGCTGCKWRVAG